MNYANMALANKGELANRASHYYPKGMNSLLTTVNSTSTVRLMASDIHYTVGCIAEAQQHAFEAKITFPQSLGIQTLKRLVKTKLIYGHHEVAEKYLSLIAKTTLHKEWAQQYSKFLYYEKTRLLMMPLEKWTQHAKVLFYEFPNIQAAFSLTHSLRMIFSQKYD